MLALALHCLICHILCVVFVTFTMLVIIIITIIVKGGLLVDSHRHPLIHITSILLGACRGPAGDCWGLLENCWWTAGELLVGCLLFVRNANTNSSYDRKPAAQHP